MISTQNLALDKPLVGVQWQNVHIGTCGRIGTTFEIFKKMGGYDESMLAMGCQDVDLVKRMWLIGSLELRTSENAFTVSNRPEEVDRFLNRKGAQQKRKEKSKENAEKLKWLPEYEKNLGCFWKICDHNGKIMKKRAKKKIWTVNDGQRIGVDVVRMIIKPRVTLANVGVPWPARHA